jgi:hypothetical protein
MKGFSILICLFCACMTIAYFLKIFTQKKSTRAKKQKLEIPLKGVQFKRKKR